MKNCLLVDDNRVIRKVARQIFEMLGYACDEAENGQVALDKCKMVPPQFILLDWNMPIMSGIDFLRALRAEPLAAQPIVVICSVENNLPHIEEALASGADEYIMKPFDADIIRGKLEQLGLAGG